MNQHSRPRTADRDDGDPRQQMNQVSFTTAPTDFPEFLGWGREGETQAESSGPQELGPEVGIWISQEKDGNAAQGQCWNRGATQGRAATA